VFELLQETVIVYYLYSQKLLSELTLKWHFSAYEHILFQSALKVTYTLLDIFQLQSYSKLRCCKLIILILILVWFQNFSYSPEEIPCNAHVYTFRQLAQQSVQIIHMYSKLQKMFRARNSKQIISLMSVHHTSIMFGNKCTLRLIS